LRTAKGGERDQQMSMTDKEFTDLQLRASICPELETAWDPPTSFLHWAHIHEAAQELRAVVGHVRAGVEEIERDKDLTPDARRRKQHELARQTMDHLEQLPIIEKARQSVGDITAKWQAKIDAVLTRPTAEDAATAVLFWEVREKFSSLKGTERMNWIEKFGNDPLVPSALLHGPAGLTNLCEAEAALLRSKVEALADPKITEAKGMVTRAMADLERGYRAAPSLVAQCAGLPGVARPLHTQPATLATPPTTVTKPPKAGGPNWPSSHSSSPAWP